MPKEKQTTVEDLMEDGLVVDAGNSPDYFTAEQVSELKELEFQYQKASLVASILEQKAKIKQLQEYINSTGAAKSTVQKINRTETDY